MSADKPDSSLGFTLELLVLLGFFKLFKIILLPIQILRILPSFYVKNYYFRESLDI